MARLTIYEGNESRIKYQGSSTARIAGSPSGLTLIADSAEMTVTLSLNPLDLRLLFKDFARALPDLEKLLDQAST